MVGDSEGTNDGLEEGCPVGKVLGLDGSPDGFLEGSPDGSPLGLRDGSPLGLRDGLPVG